MTDLGTLGSYSRAQGINDRGQVVGFSTTPSGYEHAFIWEKGQMTDLGALYSYKSLAHRINNLGQFVGDTSTDPYVWGCHATLWKR